MNWVEIVMLIAGIVVFVISFVLPEKKGSIDSNSEKEVHKLIKESLEKKMNSHENEIADMVEDKVEQSLDKIERGLERMSNEKIMAVTEYSDTVLSQIKTNHDEVVFLYDMLHNKEKSIKKTVSDLSQSLEEIKEENIEIAKEEKKVQLEDVVMKKEDDSYEQNLELDLSFLSDEVEENGNHNELILERYKAGKSKVQIAKELGIGVGEVKLVIDLFDGGK